jgi:outer membrane protein OmpA-like peptidoglycan-associated protein
MHIRSMAVVVASLSIVTAGCATKGFVREEIGKSEAKLGADVGRVETNLSEERTRTTALNDQLGQTKVAVQQADSRATEATSLARTAQGRADEGVTKATEAQAKADQAQGTASQAMTKADETATRLTRLWANRNQRVPGGDAIAILFGFDKSELDDRGQTALLDVAKQLQDNPNLVVELEGYTDSVGSVPYNVQLSQRRSEAVRRFLVEKGVELHRIQSIGLGNIRPAADNTNPKGREQNRRVMVRFFAPAE